MRIKISCLHILSKKNQFHPLKNIAILEFGQQVKHALGPKLQSPTSQSTHVTTVDRSYTPNLSHQLMHERIKDERQH